MSPDAKTHTIPVGSGREARSIITKHLQHNDATLGLFWLGGFMSNMEGQKAITCETWAQEHQANAVRFDYSGHGVSDGDFAEGSISKWLEESEAIFETLTQEPQILIGSSMGGWLALLLARKLIEEGKGDRVKGIILIAPAVDMTQDLLADHFSEEEKKSLQTDGVIYRPSAYEEPYRFYRKLIEDGEEHRLFPSPFKLSCPIHIIQGRQDPAVPWQHAAKLFDHLGQDDVSITYVKDGDHSLSRPQDLDRLSKAIGLMSETTSH